MTSRSLLITTALVGLTAATARAQFSVRGVFGGDPEINDINEAETILGSPSMGSNYSVVNFVGEGGDGDFGGGVSFPGIPNNSSDFAVEALATVTFNTPGNYTFRVNSDDGFRLRQNVNVNGTGGTVISEFVGPRGPANTDVGPMAIPGGTSTRVRLTFFERGGGDELELSYSLNGGAFALVGSTGDITVTPIPEPGSSLLAGLAALGFVSHRRRRR